MKKGLMHGEKSIHRKHINIAYTEATDFVRA